MYNVEDLEDKWKVYKSKKRIPWYAFIVVELIVVIYIANYTAVNIKLKKFLSDNNIVSFRVQSVVKTSSETNNTLVENKTPPKIEINDPELLESVEKEHQRKYLKIEVTDKHPTNKNKTKKTNKIEEREQVKNINMENDIDLEIRSAKKSFLKSKSYQDALKVAKLYYNDGQYLEAEKWALVTNNINSSVEEGWFIFVKSKVMMDNQEEAEEVLGVYIDKTGSSSAKKLLIEIQKGKL